MSEHAAPSAVESGTAAHAEAAARIAIGTDGHASLGPRKHGAAATFALPPAPGSTGS